MATPTLGLLNHTLITSADANTGWTLLTTPDSDLKKEGTASASGIFRATLATGYYTNAGGAISAVGKTVRAWMNTVNVPYMQPESLNGYQFLMYDGTNTEYKVAVGSDTYDGGWKNYVVDASLFTTLTLANTVRWGWRCNHHTSAKNAINMWADAIRYLDGYYVTGGTSGDKIRLLGIAAIDKGTTTLNGYGVLTAVDGVYFSTGKLVVGNGTTTTYFEMDGEVLIFTDQDVATGLYQLTGAGTGCNIVINNSVIKSSGTTDNTRFLVDMDDVDLASLSFTNNVITRSSTVTFKSGQTITGNTFGNCGQITPAGADMRDSVVFGYEGTADTGALYYNVATDPDGYLDRMSFTKGTASTHAIEFGTTSPLTMTLRDIDFSGYNASNGQTNSTLYFARTSGTVTVNLIGCSGTISYKSAGATISLVVDPVTVQVTVKDIDSGAVIEGARVLLWVANDTNFPYQAPITITSSGTTATVAHTGHGLATNDWVIILGAEQEAYNGAHQITVTGVDAYTFTMVETATSPATGTITSTFVVISNTTNSSGIASDSRTYNSSQAVTGWVRKATTGTLYKQQPISEIINSTSGLSVTVQMIRDE